MVSLFALLFLSMRTEYEEYSCEHTHIQINWGVCVSYQVLRQQLLYMHNLKLDVAC